MKRQEPIETLREIRSMMEKSSRFISLSGLSGVIAGISALAGVATICWNFNISLTGQEFYQLSRNNYQEEFLRQLFIVSFVVLVIALLSSILLTIRKAKSEGQAIWDTTAKRLMINLAIPLVTGGIFCISLIFENQLAFVPSATLIFYGISLLNASKYTLDEVRLLGITEILLGLVSCFALQYGLLCWALGFGVLHIIYGIIMYYRYEKQSL